VSSLGRAVRARFVRQWQGGGTPGGVRALAGGYRGLLHARQWLYDRRILTSRPLPCAVISIGNLTVGGTGKTPAVEHAVRTLQALGARPAVVSRGYGRRSTGVRVVADGRGVLLPPRDAGDEPFLLARRLPGVPVVVGANRYAAARLALDRFAVSAVVLDDGFQQRTLRKDLEIVLVRADDPWGNGRLFPAGPLREPVEALSRAHLIVVTGAAGPEAVRPVAAVAAQHAPGVPVVAARHEAVECWEARRMAREPAQALARRRLFGFAGIAWPGDFRRTLEGLGVDLAGFEAFPDHFWYGRADLDRLAGRARAAGAEGLVTTEKDWVRLGSLPVSPVSLFALDVRLVLGDGADRWHEALARPLR
jgi:tetraacyldisaccharide 4'-kinase